MSLVVRIWADENGESHFEDVDVAFVESDFVPPAPPVLLTTPESATGYAPGRSYTSSVGIVLAVMGLSVVASLWLDSIAFLFGLALLIVGSGAYALFRERRDKRESIGANDRP